MKNATDLYDYYAILENLPNGLFIIDKNKVITFWNKAAERILGYRAEEMIGKTIIVVANLKPATIRGVESHGMLLAVAGENTHAVLTTDKDVEPGMKVK